MFCTRSERALAIFLDAGFDDVDLVNSEREDMPLVHYCIAAGILKEGILKRLSFKRNMRWKGQLPVDFGNVFGRFYQ